MARRRVRVLPEEVANRIAAGEVVERPASVVKELVENSVDAGAGRVRVAIEGAGKSRITVEDDGEGMSREDAMLALERHATSKISSAEALEHVSTLGFRGEAIPSIASVSRFRLVTRTSEASEGTEIRVEGGKLLSVETSGAPRGTTVEVADLFFSVPARRKFLKGDATELRNAVDTVTQLALVHFDVGFELKSGSRTLLAVPSGQCLEERGAELVGAEAPGGLYWERTCAEGRSLVLAYAAPHEGRGHRKGVRLFVNGRPVQDRLLFRALMEGYRGVLERGRHPLVLLWLDVAPDEVDVNVHPAKREVRFREEGRIFRWVAGTAAKALARAPWATGRAAPGRLPSAVGHPGGVPPVSGAPAPTEAGGAPRPEIARVADALERYGARTRLGELPDPSGLHARQRRAPTHFGPSATPRRARGLEPQPLSLAERGRFGRLRYLGAFDATYLLFEDEDGRELVVLDQHAAHERILYEALCAEGSDHPGRSQPLLFPLTLECTTAEMAAYGERAADLESLGFQVEPFGPTTLALTSAPAAFPPNAAETAIRDVLVAELPTDANGAERREAVARRAACSAAVKARAALLPVEASELVKRLEGLQNPTHCPHGRPLLLRLARADLERMFHRT